MTEQLSDPDATKPVTRATATDDTSGAFVLTPIEPTPPALVTDTGRHPVVVIKPEPTGRFIAGLVLDVTIVVCITVLILFHEITASEGLPWIALIVGVKANQLRKPGLGSAGAVLTILGITKGITS